MHTAVSVTVYLELYQTPMMEVFFRKHLKTKIVNFFHCKIFSETGQWAVGSNPVAIT